MPQSPGNQSSETSTDFGANEWLVEEMFEQYQRDPKSVAPEWVRYFADNGTATGNGAGSTPSTTEAKAAEPRKQAPQEQPQQKA